MKRTRFTDERIISSLQSTTPLRIFGPDVTCRNGGPAKSSARIERRSFIDLQRALDTVLRGRLRDLAHGRRRFCYRKLFVSLRHEAQLSRTDRIRRLYREDGRKHPA